MADCACCGTDMTPTQPGGTRHEARGLCEPCYKREDYHGRLDDYPRRTWSREELLDEWELLRGENYTRVQAAERLGIRPSAFERALQRARAAGDPRAALGLAGGMTGAIAAAERASAAARAALETPRQEPAQWTPAHEMGDDHAMAR
jgi:hypothetical protein